MIFVYGDYRIEPYNDECWALRKRIHHDSAHALSHRKNEDSLSKKTKDWQSPICYAHDLKTIFDKLLEAVANDYDSTQVDELKTSLNAILSAQSQLYAAMTKEAMA